MSSASDAIKVAVRVRPFNRREIDLGAHRCVATPTPTSIQLLAVEGGKEPKTFEYDHVFDSSNAEDGTEKDQLREQEIVYEKLGKPLAAHVYEGYHSTLFAYGQTGSGKTHTMFGCEGCEGVTPRLANELFDIKKDMESSDQVEVDIELSFLELYNEVPRDLLTPTRKLDIREHPDTGPYVQNLSRFLTDGADDVMRLLNAGMQTRSVGATAMNHQSSRSHALCLIFITLRQKAVEGAGEDASPPMVIRSAQLTLVDLAGSERANKTGASGARLQEGANINKSLTYLGIVIRHLSQGLPGKPTFRNSKLTYLLQNALGGNSRTSMLATCSPDLTNFEETMSTCRYAWEAKRVKTHAVINEDPSIKIIKELQEEVARLRDLLSQVQGTQLEEIARLREVNRAGGKALARMMQRTREEKLQERERLDREHKEAMEALGLKAQTQGPVRPTGPHLTSLLADAVQLCYELIDEGSSTVGSDAECTIRLCGSNVMPHHLVITVADALQDEATIAPAAPDTAASSSHEDPALHKDPEETSPAVQKGDSPVIPKLMLGKSTHLSVSGQASPKPADAGDNGLPAVAYVNGQLLTEEVPLQDCDRILLGNYVFRYDNPRARAHQRGSGPGIIDFDFAVDEYKRALEVARSTPPGSARTPPRSPRGSITPRYAEYLEQSESFRMIASGQKDPKEDPPKPKVVLQPASHESLLRQKARSNKSSGMMIVEVSENERWYPLVGFKKPIKGYDPPHWSDIKLKTNLHSRQYVESMFDFSADEKWNWVEDEWNIEAWDGTVVDKKGDMKNIGWQYAGSWDGQFADRKNADGKSVRRRVWTRMRIREGLVLEDIHREGDPGTPPAGQRPAVAKSLADEMSSVGKPASVAVPPLEELRGMKLTALQSLAKEMGISEAEEDEIEGKKTYIAWIQHRSQAMVEQIEGQESQHVEDLGSTPRRMSKGGLEAMPESSQNSVQSPESKEADPCILHPILGRSAVHLASLAAGKGLPAEPASRTRSRSISVPTEKSPTDAPRLHPISTPSSVLPNPTPVPVAEPPQLQITPPTPL